MVGGLVSCEFASLNKSEFKSPGTPYCAMNASNSGVAAKYKEVDALDVPV